MLRHTNEKRDRVWVGRKEHYPSELASDCECLVGEGTITIKPTIERFAI
jgi:hypothetical protein